MPREITIPEQSIIEEIQSLQEFPADSLVRIFVGKVDSSGVFLVPQEFKMYEINGEMYQDLISANPSWNPEKPAGTYFNDDLWHFIDIIRG